MLVSWARLLGGRFRDPLVGRDLMIGGLFPLCSFLVLYLIATMVVLSGVVPQLPSVPGPQNLSAAIGPQAMASQISHAIAAGTLLVMGYLVIAFGVHLVVRRVWLTTTIAGLIITALKFYFLMEFIPLPIAAMIAVTTSTIAMWSLFRYGLLSAVVAIATFTVLGNMPWTSDLSSWAAGSMLIGLGVLVGVFGYGCYTSLAGQPIFRDVLQEGRGPTPPVH